MISIFDRDYNGVVSRGNVIVVFSGNNCPYCRVLEQAISRFEGKYPNVVFAKYNTDANGVMSSKFGIRGIPHTLFYKNGQIVHTVAGYSPTFENEVIKFYRQATNAFSCHQNIDVVDGVFSAICAYIALLVGNVMLWYGFISLCVVLAIADTIGWLLNEK